MLRNISRRALLLATWPIRYSVRQELRKQTALLHQDIGTALQRRATESTARHVEERMRDIDSVCSNLELLAMALKSAELDQQKLVCEFGVYSGRTINHIASLTEHPVYGFDSFEGLPERWRDGFGKGRFSVTSLPRVRPNVVLIKGWFDKTLPLFTKEHSEPIGFLHIDCDLYSSTKTIFDVLGHRIHPGCVIVFDEYFNFPGWEDGEYRAFQEFIMSARLAYEYVGYNRLHEQVAVKIKGGNKFHGAA